MVAYYLVQALFWHRRPPVRRSVWRAPLSGQRDPCGLSHSHSNSGTKGLEDQASSDGTCCKFFLPTRRPHEGSHVSRGSPDTAILRNMEQGVEGADAGLGGPSVWQMRRHRVSCALLTAQKRNVFSVQRFRATLVYSSGFVGWCWGLWGTEVR